MIRLLLSLAALAALSGGATAEPRAAASSEAVAARPALAGNVGVAIPALAVVHVVAGQATQAWTNSGLPPRLDDRVLVRRGADRRPATAAERAALVRCARQADATWEPGQWVSLSGAACRL